MSRLAKVHVLVSVPFPSVWHRVDNSLVSSKLESQPIGAELGEWQNHLTPTLLRIVP